MDEFTIEIAEVPVAVRCGFGSTKEYFRQYLSDRESAFSVCICTNDLTHEQEMLDAEADRDGLRRRVFTDPFLERAAIQRKIAYLCLPQDIMLLHGSTIAVDGKAYLFTAACGVGKSTHTRLWRQHFGDRAVMINDDRAFLRICPDGVQAYGSPWSGKHGLHSNVTAPLAGICILQRGTQNRIVPIEPCEALPDLLEQAYLPEENFRQQLGTITARLADAVPLWKMACNKEPEAAEVAYRAMAEQ